MEKIQYERPVIKRIVATMPDKFGIKSKMEPIIRIDGVPVKQLLSDFGSPLYVISERKIREKYREARQAFSTRYPKVQFTWSYKTNYLNAVCNVYHQEGSWAEVVSGFEYEKALANGVPGKRIIFNGPYKSKEDLIRAVNDEALIHIDNFDELYTLVELAGTTEKKPKVAIRINMDTGIYPQWSRFGFNYDNGEAWEAVNRIMLSKKLELTGLHTHIGTYIMAAHPYQVAAAKMAELAVRISKKYNHHINYIDLGGGFASKNTLKGAYLPGTDTCPGFEEYADAITTVLISSDIPQEHLPALFLETGRALVDDAGYILGTVLANKRLADQKRAMIIDIGVNLLFTSFWYEHNIVPAQPFSYHTEECAICGPLCMNIDVIREHIAFPILNKGDHVVISRIGAYNCTQWLQFITYRPKVVMIDMEGNPHVIRENEDLKTLVSLEKTPEHLKKFKL
ncbi:MAG: alanine racemase [Bacteroidetes bacterium]|nr:alanine racemase [Bacteroidota bacterium]